MCSFKSLDGMLPLWKVSEDLYMEGRGVEEPTPKCLDSRQMKGS